MTQEPQQPNWDTVAQEYEARVEPFTNLFAPDLLSKFLSPKPNTGQTSVSFLDVGCGTGALSLYAAQHFDDVTACDVSHSMVMRLEQRSEQIHTVVCDGQNLPNEFTNQFDYAASCFAVIFFPDPLRGLREIWRCLKPRTGRVAISAWGDTSETAAFSIFPEVLREVLPANQHELIKPKRIIGSHKSLQQLLLEAGFVNVKVVGPIQKLLHLKTAEDYYDRFALTSPHLQNVLATLSCQQRETVRARVQEMAVQRSLEHDGSVCLPSSAYFAYGDKPCI